MPPSLPGNGYARYLLARRMMWSILLFSSLVTLLATSLQLYLDYRRDVDQIESRLHEIESTHLKNITQAVWLTHNDLVRSQLEGIMRLPDMVHARVELVEGERIEVVAQGQRSGVIERRLPLITTFRGQSVALGHFIVAATLDGVYQRLLDKALVILATQTIKTFLVSFFILYLFYLLVGRHLHAMADYARQVRLHDLPVTPPVLRRPPPQGGRLDELDQLSLAIGDMVEELKVSYQQMHASQLMLEESIAQRQGVEQELKESAARLRQAEKMEAIGTLAGGVAHDFNNILAIIFGNAEMGLLEGANGQRERFQAVLTAAERARELIRQLLTFSRQADDKQEWFSPEATVKEALKFLRATLPATVQMQSRVKTGGMAILANPVQIYQVLLNLCTNAAHAMEEQGGGVLTVEVAPVMLTAEESVQLNLKAGSHLRLLVRNTGGGMTAAVKERIFEPFFTTKPVGKGTGLGLAVVHGVVTGCGGVVTVESEPGQWTLFIIHLPARALIVESTQEREESAMVTTGGVIMVVDDEPQLVDVAMAMLGRLGLAAEGWHDPGQAWERFRQRPERYRAVITDQTMPGLTGIEFVGLIHGLRPDMPVFLATGFSNAVNQETAREHGFAGFLSKPFRIGELNKALRAGLGEGEFVTVTFQDPESL